jgi:DNA-binding transcriptional LysR family regulator
MRSDLIDRRIKLHHLKIVIAVAQWRSMAKAAKHLAISQPVVSKAVADLEFVLGVSLFDRSPHGVEPTAYGRALLRRGIAIFDDLQTGVDEIRFMADPTTGELRIGTTEPLLAGLGLRVMEQLWGKHPKINFHFVEADSSALLNREVPERRVELALVPLLSASLHAELDATILFHDHLRVVVGAKSPWAQRREITLAELTGESWCLAPSPIGSLVASAFPASGLPKPRVAVTATTTHLLFQLLESGRFIGHLRCSRSTFRQPRAAAGGDSRARGEVGRLRQRRPAPCKGDQNAEGAEACHRAESCPVHVLTSSVLWAPADFTCRPWREYRTRSPRSRRP